MTQPDEHRSARRRRRCLAVMAAAVIACGCVAQAPDPVLEQADRFTEIVPLPEPSTAGGPTLEQALRLRRSVRSYRPDPLSIEIIGQLLWSGQGVTDGHGHRTAPSAGATYPLELYALTKDEFWHYLPDGHRVEAREVDGVLEDLSSAAFGQEFVETAPAVIIVSGVVARTEADYGPLASRLVDREAGHASQNILLQAVALGLAAVPVGGFDPSEVGERLALPAGEEVLYLIPVGYPDGDGR